MTVDVFILTTEGPVGIQRITPEDPLVHSVICVDGLAQALPVSHAYDAFVRRPTGIVERMTGHGAYRVDVDGAIDNGRSWQLALALAHAAETSAAEPMTVYATGEVDRDLNIRPVEQVARKLARLEERFSNRPPDVERTIILVPDDAPGLPIAVGGVPVLTVATLADALAAVRLPPPTEAPTPVAADPKPGGAAGRWLRLGVGSLIVAGVVLWLILDIARWQSLTEDGAALKLEEALGAADANGGLDAVRAGIYRRWLVFMRPDVGGLIFDGNLTSASSPAGCRAGEVQQMPLLPTYDGTDTVCSIGIRGFHDTPSQILIGRLAYWPNGLGADVRAERTMRGSGQVDGRVWTLDFQAYPGKEAHVRLVTILGPADVSGAQPWFRDLLSMPMESAAYRAAVARIERLGYAVRSLDWHRQ